MTGSTDTHADQYLRFARRSMFVLLLSVLLLGGLCIGFAFRPEDAMLESASRIVPIVIAIAGVSLATAARRAGLRPGSPESEAVLADEFRQLNLARATRIAFLVVVLIQVPLALCLTSLPVLRALLAMGTATITLALATLAATYLVFDRE